MVSIVKWDDGDPINGQVYSIDEMPRHSGRPDKAALAGCSTDNGDGTGSYDVDDDTDNVCLIRVLGAL